METDSVGVLQNGVTLGIETYKDFRTVLAWPADAPDKIICHQVGATHQKTFWMPSGFLKKRILPPFGTWKYRNVSLPITAAIAAEREFLLPVTGWVFSESAALKLPHAGD